MKDINKSVGIAETSNTNDSIYDLLLSADPPKKVKEMTLKSKRM